MVSTISRLSAVRKAGRWQRKGYDWHFHLLSPGCLFNPTKTHELFIESNRGNYVVRSHKSLTETASQLVPLLRQRQTTRFSSTPVKGKLTPILERVKQI